MGHLARFFALPIKSQRASLTEQQRTGLIKRENLAKLFENDWPLVLSNSGLYPSNIFFQERGEFACSNWSQVEVCPFGVSAASIDRFLGQYDGSGIWRLVKDYGIWKRTFFHKLEENMPWRWDERIHVALLLGQFLNRKHALGEVFYGGDTAYGDIEHRCSLGKKTQRTRFRSRSRRNSIPSNSSSGGGGGVGLLSQWQYGYEAIVPDGAISGDLGDPPRRIDHWHQQHAVWRLRLRRHHARASAVSPFEAGSRCARARRRHGAVSTTFVSRRHSPVVDPASEGPEGRFALFPQSDFSEGVYTDHRHFDKEDTMTTPRFEFGFGLSYTTFALSNATVRRRGGAAVHLRPGESLTATFALTRRDLSVWNVEAQRWQLQRGTYTIEVGTSSRDLPLKLSLEI
ncbi:hypothetical protein MY10362_005027 [Beauveria mimosiformis]